jgi:hypothetical protein
LRRRDVGACTDARTASSGAALVALRREIASNSRSVYHVFMICP